jgi:hypothetical protein
MSNDTYEEIIGHVPETYPDFDTVHVVSPATRDDLRTDRNQKITHTRYYQGLIFDTNVILCPLVSGEDGSGFRSIDAICKHLTIFR